MYLAGILNYFYRRLHADAVKKYCLFQETAFSEIEIDAEIRKMLQLFVPLVFSKYKKYSKETVERVYYRFLDFFVEAQGVLMRHGAQADLFVEEV